MAATKSMIAGLVAGAALVGAWASDAAIDAGARGVCRRRLGAPRAGAGALVEAIAQASSAFVLGRGSTFAIAAEAALKLKETCAMHAEAFSAAEVMHGPAEIVRPGFLVLALPAARRGGGGV